MLTAPEPTSMPIAAMTARAARRGNGNLMRNSRTDACRGSSRGEARDVSS
jgi:hypothetical protein